MTGNDIEFLEYNKENKEVLTQVIHEKIMSTHMFSNSIRIRWEILCFESRNPYYF
jgi:hypothetical protein